MYINTKQVAKMIGRDGSAVDKYVKMEKLPPHKIKVADLPLPRDSNQKNLKGRLWDEAEVLAWMPKVKEYQARKNGDCRSKPRKKKTSHW